MAVNVNPEYMLYHRDVINTCLNCRRPRCVNNCPEYKEACKEAAADVFAKSERRRKRRKRGALYEINGERHTISQWARIVGVNAQIIYSRLNIGMTLQQALEKGEVQKPANRLGELKAFGKSCTLLEWAREYGIAYKTLYNRVAIQKLPLEEALTQPVKRGGARKRKEIQK